MNCDEVCDLLHGFADGELAAADEQMLVRHLQSCPACSNQLDDIKALSAMLGKGGRLEAPTDLDAKIRSGLDSEDAKSTPGWAAARLPHIASHAAALALGIGLTVLALGTEVNLGTDMNLGSRGTRGSAAVQELVSVHIRHLMAEQFASVASSDKHQVRPWFVGKIDYAPPMVDLAAEGFPLTGGRIDYLSGRTTAVLTYARRKHLIDVYVVPRQLRSDRAQVDRARADPARSDTNGKTASAHVSPVQTSLRGFNLAGYHTDDFAFQMISDLNAKELDEFARLMEQKIERPAGTAPAQK